MSKATKSKCPDPNCKAVTFEQVDLPITNSFKVGDTVKAIRCAVCGTVVGIISN